MFRGISRNSKRRAFPHKGTELLPPRLNRTFYIKNRYPFTDLDGKHDGPPQLLQYIQGPVDLLNASLVGTETVTSKQGTATVTVSAGKLSVGSGTLWSFALSNGSQFEFGTALTATTGVVFDVSGDGRHLLFTVADTAAVCISGREKGSDWLDEMGWIRRENRIAKSEPTTLADVNLKQNVTCEAATWPMSQYCTHVVRFAPGINVAYAWQSGTNSAEYTEASMIVMMDDGSPPIVRQPDDAGDLALSINGSLTGTTVKKVEALGDGVYKIIVSRKSTGSSGYCGAYRSALHTGRGFVCSMFAVQREAINREYKKTTGYAINCKIPIATNDSYKYKKTEKELIISCEGDSRTNIVSPTTAFWPQYLLSKIPVIGNARILNFAAGGNPVSLMVTQYPAQAGAVVLQPAGYGYFIEYGGANDLGPGINATGLATYNNKKLLWAAARASGYIVVASTEAGSGGWTTQQNSEKAAMNALIRSDSSLYDYLLEPDIHPQLSLLTDTRYYLDTLHLTTLGSEVFAQMVADVIMPGLALQYYDNQYPGPVKLNITTISHPSDTSIIPTHTYKFADAHRMRIALGWTWGVDHWAYNADGTPKTILGSILIDNGIGYQFYCGDKGLAGYSQTQDAVSNTKIIRALRVHTYIDTLYFADHQEMDWSETNE